eukprot:TRINITY_DN2702_c0_g1_i1.p1 TRINITY_DN2702_c0_g1~~TRINITY_DN2702_c0_g1_i1.p1  ORF type:complete len:293 (-),score=16.84 TRINITY_DN2702_c0_g1_i1:81-959(-)
MKKTSSGCCGFVGVSRSEAPPWVLGNPYLTTGYRKQLSPRGCLKSVFQLHNETVNIWTHLVPSLGVLCFGVYLLIFIVSHRSLVDKVFLSLSILSGSLCYLFSSIYHTFGCHSQQIHQMFFNFDIFGILIALNGAIIATIYFGYYCFTFWRYFHIWTVFILGLFSIFIIFGVPMIADKNLRSYFSRIRTPIMSCYFCYGLVPLGHWVYLNGFSSLIVSMYLWRILLSYVFMGLGFVFYKFFIPECWFIGKFDIFGCSHQWWHVFTVLGTLSQLYTAIHFLSFIDKYPCLPHT